MKWREYFENVNVERIISLSTWQRRIPVPVQPYIAMGFVIFYLTLRLHGRKHFNYTRKPPPSLPFTLLSSPPPRIMAAAPSPHP
jgi:hypothetical protein